MKYFWNILGIILSLSFIYALYGMNFNSFVQDRVFYDSKGYYIAHGRALVGLERYYMLTPFLVTLLFIISLIFEIKYPNATIGDNLCLKGDRELLSQTKQT